MTRFWNAFRRVRIGSTFTPALRAVLIGTVGVFVVQIALYAVLSPSSYQAAVRLFGLSVRGAILELRLWQLGTYMLLHSVGDPLHLAVNMLVLWMFGGELERAVGARRFVELYVLGGVFAGLLCCLFYGLSGLWHGEDLVVPVIGASGAVCAVLAAFGTLFPNRVILLFFLIPVKVKHAILLIAALEALVTVLSVPGIAAIAHLGGLGFGFLSIRYGWSARNVFVFLSARRSVRRTDRDQVMQERVDRVLAKLSAEGVDRLSWRERRLLKRASKRYRQTSARLDGAARQSRRPDGPSGC